MKWPWKKIWGGVKKGVDLASAFGVPFAGAVDKVIDRAEDAFPDAPGETKLTFVEEVTDAIFASDLTKLSPAQQAAFQAARQEYIAAAVEFRHATARVQAASQALVQALHAPPDAVPADVTPLPA